MLKKIVYILKRIIMAVFVIYSYNKLAISEYLFIPMNYFTISLVGFLGIPSIIMIVLFSLFCL
ncbi:MAG: pro-sigmaK processing inhibitor BofA family protein [Bacilli bacterium]|nr:pro-sigmaK processing inhibitor BofA family protein [Bacilli bacterium]